MRAETQQGQQQVQKHIKYDEIGLKHKNKTKQNKNLETFFFLKY
jgi:hypothetical protein